MKTKYHAPGDQRRIDFIKRIFSRGADQQDRSILHGRQQGILLGLVKAVDLVDKKNRLLAIQFEAIGGRGDDPPDVGDPGGHGI